MISQCQFLALRPVSALCSSLPEKSVYWAARQLGRLDYLTSRPQRRRAANSMRVLLGKDASPGELRQKVRSAFNEFALHMAEFMRTPAMDKPKGSFQKFIQEKVEVVGIDQVDDFLTSGRGAVLVWMHFSNWDWKLCISNFLGLDVLVPAARMPNRHVDRFFTELRTYHGQKIVRSYRGIAHCREQLRDGKAVAMAAEVMMSRHAIPVEFFGRQIQVPAGPAILARRYGCPLIPTCMPRIAPDRFRLVFGDPILPESAGEGPEKEQLQQLAQQYMAWFEDYVRQYPEQWSMIFWLNIFET